MSKINYLKDIPLDSIVCDKDTVVMKREIFEQLADYSRSHPTGPKPGRIFRKALNWSNKQDPNWFVYICWSDGDTDGVWNRGRKVYLL